MIKAFVHVVLPIALGGIIYLLFRWHYFNVWINPPDWVRYNLPDFLWLYSLISFLLIVWGYQIKGGLIIWVGISLVLAVTSEYMQKKGIISGTFDWMDISAYAIAFLLSLTVNINHIKKFQ